MGSEGDDEGRDGRIYWPAVTCFCFIHVLSSKFKMDCL